MEPVKEPEAPVTFNGFAREDIVEWCYPNLNFLQMVGGPRVIDDNAGEEVVSVK